MLIFPTISGPSISTPCSVQNNALTSETVNGVTIARPRYFRQLERYNVQWNALSETDLNILLAFYERTFGGSLFFAWDNPRGQTIRARFAGNVQYTRVAGNLFKVSLEIAEV